VTMEDDLRHEVVDWGGSLVGQELAFAVEGAKAARRRQGVLSRQDTASFRMLETIASMR